MQNYDKIKELRRLHIRQRELEGELRVFFKNKAEAERKFIDGEKVHIYNSKGELKGEGIIAGAFIWVSLDGYQIKDYDGNEEKYLQAISEIQYKVMAVKKDGTASSRVAFGNRSYLDTTDKYGWRDYITKIEQPLSV